jgi:hypothetical protein
MSSCRCWKSAEVLVLAVRVRVVAAQPVVLAVWRQRQLARQFGYVLRPFEGSAWHKSEVVRLGGRLGRELRTFEVPQE